MEKENTFKLEKFIDDIFAPGNNEILTIMIDIPTENSPDNSAWRERRVMGEEWLEKIKKNSEKWNLKVNPLVKYNATGANNGDLPQTCKIGNSESTLVSVIDNSTIIISMPTFSATAPLYEYSMKRNNLRVASMPGVERFMEETGLSADYSEISRKCSILQKLFSSASSANVIFSSGHRCQFDIEINTPMIDNGILHPEMGGTEYSLSNLPAGEVYVVPDESSKSRTIGDIPVMVESELVILKVKENKIIDILGNGKLAEQFKKEFDLDPARRNIAEFAIGVNPKATVTGNVLQDEKAGFHWAYGRSDHLGGSFGVESFLSPENVVHQDIVYAKGNSVECSELTLIMKNGSSELIIKNSELLI